MSVITRARPGWLGLAHDLFRTFPRANRLAASNRGRSAAARRAYTGPVAHTAAPVIHGKHPASGTELCEFILTNLPS